MLTPQLVVTLTDPETGRPRPTAMDELPPPVTAAEAGLMAGVPVPEDKRVHHGNWLSWPNIRWSFTHVDELRSSARITAAGPVGDSLLEAGSPGGGEAANLDLSGLAETLIITQAILLMPDFCLPIHHLNGHQGVR